MGATHSHHRGYKRHAKRKLQETTNIEYAKHKRLKRLGGKESLRRAWLASWPRSSRPLRIESLLLLRHGEPHVQGDFGAIIDEDAKDASLPGLRHCGFANLPVFVGALVLVAKHYAMKHNVNPMLLSGVLVGLASKLEKGLMSWEQAMQVLERAFVSTPPRSLEGGQWWHSAWAKYLFAAFAGTSVSGTADHGNYVATALVEVTPQTFEAMPYNTISGFGHVEPELAVRMARSLYEKKHVHKAAEADTTLDVQALDTSAVAGKGVQALDTSTVAGKGVQALDTSAVAGKVIKIAVIDEGVDIAHPALKNNIWTNPGEVCGDNIDNDGNNLVDDCHGWDFVQQSHVVTGHAGHGTHVAGIVVANSKRNGVMGMAYEAQIMVLRTNRDVKNNERYVGAKNVVSQAIRYAVDNHADIINYSGHLNANADTDAALEYAYSKGVVVVAAAGNDGLDGPNYPARHPTCIAVGNALDNKTLNSNSHRAGQNSNFVSAPGTNVWSTWPGNKYARRTGTSMASPYVTDVVARMLSANPDMTPKDVMNVLALTSSNSKVAKQAAQMSPSVPFVLLALAGAATVNAIHKRVLKNSNKGYDPENRPWSIPD